jgi:regulator of Ty1 transposition protein 103
MGPFSEGDLVKRLNELRDSQKEIQNVSAWIVHHRLHSRDVIKVWYKNFKQGPKARKLTYMYLANDVVQNSRRKGPEYSKEFGSILQKVYHHLASLDIDEKSIGAYGRLLSIWNERQIFDKKLLQEVTQLWNHKTSKVKQRQSSGTPRQSSEERRKSTEIVDIDEMLESPLRKLVQPMHEETTTLSPRAVGSPGSGDPPEPEELITALQELENAASSDAEVREKIAKLPPDVSEVSKLDNLESSEEGLHLLQQVNDASELLSTYNGRLQDELKERKKVGTMVSEFLSAQKELLAQAEERLELYHEKLEKIKNLKEDLKDHIAALPDIPVLPTSSRLAPLPGPGELFY